MRSALLYAPERHQQILDTARVRGRVEVAGLARELSVTPETVRRDLTALERRGVLRENAERQALNSPIQGTAADIVKRAMLGIDADIRERGLGSRMLLQVHDELVLEVAPGELDELSAILTDRMTHAADLKVPLDVQLGTGANWDAAAH